MPIRADPFTVIEEALDFAVTTGGDEVREVRHVVLEALRTGRLWLCDNGPNGPRFCADCKIKEAKE